MLSFVPEPTYAPLCGLLRCLLRRSRLRARLCRRGRLRNRLLGLFRLRLFAPVRHGERHTVFRPFQPHADVPHQIKRAKADRHDQQNRKNSLQPPARSPGAAPSHRGRLFALGLIDICLIAPLWSPLL